MYRCQSWTVKKAERWRTDAFELWCWRRLSRSPWDCKEIEPIHPKGNQPWIFVGRTDAEAPILRPPDAMSKLVGKDPDAGKDWRQEEKGTTEDEMVGWHRWLNGHEFEQTLGVGDGQGGLACCSPSGRRVGHNWARDVGLPGAHQRVPQVPCQNGRDVFSPVPHSSIMWFLSSHVLLFIKNMHFHISSKSNAQGWLGSYARRLENS